MNRYIPCPHCGADIPANATSCKHCGSSDSDGWGDEYDDDGGYGAYGEDDFDYDEYLQREFPSESESGGIYTDTKPLYRLISIVLLIAFAFGILALAF